MRAKINQDVTLNYWLSAETGVWRWPHMVHRDRKDGAMTTLFLRETRLTEYNDSSRIERSDGTRTANC